MTISLKLQVCVLFSLAAFLLSCSGENLPSDNLSKGEHLSSASVEPDPSILECPPEDTIPPSMSDSGRCGFLKLSVEELSFGKQGGVRCITASELSYPSGSGSRYLDEWCRDEYIVVSDTVNDPPHFIGVTKFKKMVCPWFTAMITSEDKRVIHISVDKNETGKERKMIMSVSAGDCHVWPTITQSAE